MGRLSNKIDKSELKKGDHIYSYRKAHLYTNHGIFVGENRVIHYMSPSTSNGVCNTCGYDPSMQRGVVKTGLDCFLDGHRLHWFEYEVSSVHYLAKLPGTCYTGPCDNPDVVVGRATKILDNNGCADYGNFKLFDQNSVSFAVLCMTGHPQCAHEVAAKSNVNMVVDSLSSLMSLETTLGLIAVGLGGI